jgi:hypothetical protein
MYPGERELVRNGFNLRRCVMRRLTMVLSAKRKQHEKTILILMAAASLTIANANADLTKSQKENAQAIGRK